MSDSFFQAFKPSPLSELDLESLEDKAQPNIEHLPITTRKGRVVYNRKPHKFDENDLLRITQKVLTPEIDPKKPDFERLLMEITIWMMEVILDRISFGKVDDDTARNLYNNIWNLLNGVIKKFTPSQVSAIVPKDEQGTYIV